MSALFLTYKYRSGLSVENKGIQIVSSSEELEKEIVRANVEKERLKVEKKKTKSEVKKTKKYKK